MMCDTDTEMVGLLRRGRACHHWVPGHGYGCLIAWLFGLDRKVLLASRRDFYEG